MKHRPADIAFLAIASISIVNFVGCNRPTAATSPKSVTGNGNPTSRSSVVRVAVIKPERKTLSRITTQPGYIEAFERTPLYAKLDGYVRKTRTVIAENGKPVEKEIADIGDKVKENDVLAELWMPEMDEELRQKDALVMQATAELDQSAQAVLVSQKAEESARARIREAEAGIVRAEGEYERWKAEYHRIKELAARGSVTRKLADETLNQFRAADAARREANAKVDAAKAALGESQANIAKAKADQAAAAARLKVAEANVLRMKALLAYAKIRAPFAGVVTERNVNTGHFVRPPQGNSAKPLFVVVRSDTVRIFVDVPELEAVLVDLGDPAFIKVQALGGDGIDRKVTRTAWVLDAAARTLRTEIDVPNKDGRLRPGMYATVRIVLEERKNVLTLPVSSIVTEGGQPYCCCVEAGKVVRKSLTLGLRSGDEVEIRAGLTGDETVVRTNPASLQADQAVEVTE
jgi:RND family efflux transporter MFP subunit